MENRDTRRGTLVPAVVLSLALMALGAGTWLWIAQDDSVQAIVWLDTGVTDDDVAAIERFLDGHRSVVDHRYLGDEETFEEFSEYFAEQPEVIDLVEPEQLPNSFELTATEIELLQQDVELIEGVDEFTTKQEASFLDGLRDRWRRWTGG